MPSRSQTWQPLDFEKYDGHKLGKNISDLLDRSIFPPGIIFLALSSAWFGFSVIERLNIIETELQLMQQDLLEASTQKPIDQEQFMLLEFLSSNQEKLKEKVEEEIPNIKKNDMTLQFHEERILSLIHI